jgi:hypothetical protein
VQRRTAIIPENRENARDCREQRRGAGYERARAALVFFVASTAIVGASAALLWFFLG